MVPLDAEVNDPRVGTAAGGRERAVDHGEAPLATQVPDCVGEPERDVDGLVRADGLALDVRDGGTFADRGPASTGARSAADGKGEGLLG